jgi:haloacid dehalogenase-like hydrolase
VSVPSPSVLNTHPAKKQSAFAILLVVSHTTLRFLLQTRLQHFFLSTEWNSLTRLTVVPLPNVTVGPRHGSCTSKSIPANCVHLEELLFKRHSSSSLPLPRRYHAPLVVYLLSLLIGLASCNTQTVPPDLLPSWNDGPAKKGILDFVARTTTAGSPDYVPVAERIATFDNDGTLWTEHPLCTQFVFALDRVKVLAPEHPEGKQKQPFKGVLEGDLKGVEASGEKGLVELMMATHAGMTTDEFAQIVNDWMAKSQHPRFKRPYTECVFQPMLELLAYLRSNSFKTYIVSGGGVEFMRPWTEKIYGVPPERVVGSSVKTRFELRGGQPVLLRLPEVDVIDDKAGKPGGINKFVGRRPIASFGNSDGDLEMLQWTAAGKGARLVLIVHHTDAEREYAYDRESPIGTLDRAWDEANAKGWVVLDMKRDWITIFPPPTQ